MAKGAPKGPKPSTVYPAGFKVVTGPGFIPSGTYGQPQQRQDVIVTNNATTKVPTPSLDSSGVMSD